MPAFIASGPTNFLATNGQSVTFSVVAGGDLPLQYAWRLNAMLLSQATNSNYIISSANSSHEGGYTVVVSNAFGSVTSQVAQLTVLKSNEITISQITLVANQPFISIPSRIGLTYVTEFKSLLEAPAWIPVSTNAGTGAVLGIPLPGAAFTSAFYRVRIF